MLSQSPKTFPALFQSLFPYTTATMLQQAAVFGGTSLFSILPLLLNFETTL